MAPPPEYDKEPKAPDKNATTTSNEDSKFSNSINDQQTKSDHKTTNTVANSEGEKSKADNSVENLDDGRLRALLDEAITYKCPKDREGKSDLFKNLLEEAEQDDQASEAAARCSGGRARRGAGRRALAHSNSLQDLVAAALAAEPAPRRPRPHAPVSARATHGGSLPSGVDTSFLLGEEPTRGGYLATVRCVNPPPLAERRVSASDANCPAEVELLHRRSKPVFPMTYTARATLEIGSGSVSSGRAVTTTTASNQGDSAIPFSCITTPEVVSSCNTTSSTSQSAVAVDPKPRSVISSSFNGLTLSRPNYGATAAAADEYKKSLDENGNAVQGFSSPISGSSQHKKPRRKKSSKNETVIKSHQIDGYQGNKDLNEVLRFIESNAEHGRGAKLGRAKHNDADDKAGKKRSSERRKDKESKVKRASSLEERSRTKLEDLTDAPPPRRHERKPRPDNKAERRSWGDDARDAFYYSAPAPAPPETEPELDHEPEPEPAPEREPEPAPAPAPPPAPPDTAVELTDFQTVTKRRKPRRRTDDAEREPPRRPRPPSPRPRRESAPPSDRSNDSNDDLDSVHSLPPPPPPPPAPHASYADIARTRHNIPDLIESCNFYAEGESAARLARGKAPPRRERKERAAAAAGGECPAPDVVGDRRPAVILLDSAARGRDMDGVTFGFDINEQLLGAGGRRPRCDLVRDAPDALPVRAAPGLRYRPPDPPPDTNHLHQIIDYVASAWEDVIRCGGGKVRYFSD